MLKNLEAVHRAIKLLEVTSKCTTISARRLNAWAKDGTIKSPFKSIEVPNCTLYEYIWQNLERWPERTVTVCATTGRGYTYEQAFKLSNTFAANLRKKFRLRDGDTVAVMLPNIPDFPLVALGILEAGGIISTINPIYTPHEIQRQLLLSEAKAVVTISETVATVREAIQLAKLNIPIIAVKSNGESVPQGIVSFHELTEDVHIDKSCLKEVRRSIDDICFLPYSSGTTGLPKGVQLSSRNLIANCEQLNEPFIRCHNDTTATHQDAIMTVLPLFHIYGASVLMFHKMTQGIKLVTMAKFQPETFLNALQKYKTNIIFVAPPLVIMMATHPAGLPEKFQYLETIVNGAAPLAETDAERFISKSKRKLDFRQGYGLTETSPVVTLTPRGLDNYGCVGYPIPNTDLKIVNSEMKILGPNEKGELLVKGPQVMRGYKDNAAADKETFTEDGWFRTGDLAIADHTGNVSIADRLKELIKVKGFQVPPAELEAVLREHPDVNEAAVVGVPHPTKGESPKAFIVLKSNTNTSAKEISQFVDKKVASYKRIEDITFIDSIPKSSAGKILRRELKEKFC
ncbi:PREDICTED: 4-coumarate--CoA ligase 1-like [Papilio polytes]|uniref:4-coumarate--CoA ligase 1-like n=1 Tax=Papilio polytes TaxID=76194 RepID=UPI0006765011|nr:PREDICTED: 4-coumarate--CoA ligase 1-like [Papilio polytes]